MQFGKEAAVKRILLAIGILLLLNVIVLLFIANYHAGFLVQGLLAAAIIAYALFFDHFTKIVHAVMGILCVTPLLFMAFLAVYGNIGSAEYNEDAVIVLGAGVRGEQVGETLARRLDRAAEYHAVNSDALIVVCGGQGPQEHITEALAMERYLLDKGIPQEKIIKEDKSSSTHENLAFAAEILESLFPQGYTAVLVTSDFHVFRAARMANALGITANHIGAGVSWYTVPVNYLREILAVGKMIISE